jgi:hypothetical protein
MKYGTGEKGQVKNNLCTNLILLRIFEGKGNSAHESSNLGMISEFHKVRLIHRNVML